MSKPLERLGPLVWGVDGVAGDADLAQLGDAPKASGLALAEVGAAREGADVPNDPDDLWSGPEVRRLRGTLGVLNDARAHCHALAGWTSGLLDGSGGSNTDGTDPLRILAVFVADAGVDADSDV